MPTQKPCGLIPVGAGGAWLGSLTNTPALPDEFVQCNGQLLSDPQSIFNGQTIPDLNGSVSSKPCLLRGMPTSGSTGGSDTHTHSLATNPVALGLLGTGLAYRQLTMNVGDASTLPQYYTVIYVLRVK